MNTEFEKYAREQLDGHEIQVDTETLWTNVYPHVKKDNGNRYLTWIFLFGLFAIAGTLSLLNYQHNRSFVAEDLTEVVSSKSIADQNNYKTQPCLLYTSPSPRDRG